MKRLSSFWTPFAKWVIPAIVLGCFVVGVISTAASGGISSSQLAGFCVAVAGVLFLQKVLASDLADDVVDLGDFLVIKRGKVKDRVSLANLLRVESSVAVSPPRMTLHFVVPGAFGKSVSFMPVSSRSLNPLARHPLVEELMARAQQARAHTRAHDAGATKAA